MIFSKTKDKSIEEFLDRFNYGFALCEDGKYRTSILHKQDNTYVRLDEFFELIYKYLGFTIYIPGDFYIVSNINPKCNEFISHKTGSIYEKNKYYSWFISNGYEIEKDPYTSCDNSKRFNKYLSVSEFKELIIYFVYEYMKDNKELLENKEKFNTHGAIFIKCEG